MVELHFASGMAVDAIGERPGAMCPLPFLHQVANRGIVQHGGSTGLLSWNSMTVGTVTRACRSEHELAMRIVQDSYGNRRQDTVMLDVTAEA
jgi:hypothetical protein